MPRTLHLHWPALTSDAAALQLRNAQHALGRISPLVYGSGTRIEIGIDGLQARNGDERGVVAAALRSVRTHLRAAPFCAISSIACNTPTMRKPIRYRATPLIKP